MQVDRAEGELLAVEALRQPSFPFPSPFALLR